MTLYDLYHRIQDIGIQLHSIQIPILKDGVVEHIEMIEK